MLKRTLLGRAAEFTAAHGIDQKNRDYLSLVKNQTEEGISWAYALASAAEMSYAMASGNRLKLSPHSFYNDTVTKYWQDKKNKTYERCNYFGKDKGYDPICVIEYMIATTNPIMQEDKISSLIEIKEGKQLKITTVQDLYKLLDEHKILYLAINNTHLNGNQFVHTYYTEANDATNHAVVLTAAGTVENKPGVYVELLNSNGYVGYQYVKVAENETSTLINNMKMFNSPIYIKVERVLYEEYITVAKVMTILFFITLFITIVLSIVSCVCCCLACRNRRSYSESSINRGLTA